MEKIDFNLFGITFSDTIQGFLKKLDYYDEDEVKTGNFYFDYQDNSYTADLDEDGWSIYGGGVDSAAKLISEYDTEGAYVLEQAWIAGDDSSDIFEVYFLNCECPEFLKKYYADGLFIEGPDDKLAEANSDYFNDISEVFFDFDNIEVKSDAEACEYSNWPENSYGERYFSNIQR